MSKKLKHQSAGIWFGLRFTNKKKENLLADNSEIQTRFFGMSRREVIRKIGINSMVARPAISLLAAPNAVAAQSCADPGGEPAVTNLFPGVACDNSNTAACQSSCNINDG